MMLNKMPADTPISLVLNHLETATKWGARNRAMFALRQRLRIRDISMLRVTDVLGFDGRVRGHFISEDGLVFQFDQALKAELHRYLLNRFELEGDSLKSLISMDMNIPLFPTQKRERFSNNTLAQHFCYLDKSIWARFKPAQAVKKASITQRLMSSFSSV